MRRERAGRAARAADPEAPRHRVALGSGEVRQLLGREAASRRLAVHTCANLTLSA